EGIAAMRQEARDLGLVFDQEAADAAAQFTDDLDRLKKGFTGVFQESGRNLLPVLNNLLPVMRDNLIPAVLRLGEMIGRLITWFGHLAPHWQGLILGATGAAAALGPMLVALGSLIKTAGTLITVLPKLGAAFTAMTGPVGLVVVAIAAAIAIGVT